MEIYRYGRIHKEYYSANARFLSDEAIKEIKTSFGRVPDAINTMAKKHRISYIQVKEYIENWERKQQMIYSHSSQIQSAMSPEIISISLNKELENNYISLLQGRLLSDSLNHGSSSLCTSNNTSDKQTKKR
ncbi:846_t:CDS:2 [Funneliformis mosseae]|uniref:846_t:CDS:1 n=1 Tax=Funneliformis mosseae TaxID=27381 RepID=A0A9N8ZFM1_FUNMO|nr:846_t:CDS:2 [Funneliformis mosseae]